ncbi:MAG: YCF48-related protein [Bacteroidia bacterium]
MKYIFKSSISVVLWLSIKISFAQWTLVNSIPNKDIIALKTNQDAIYAATLNNIIYKSLDGGSTWTTITVSNNPIEIQSIEFIDNKIFIGTVSNGIFQSNDNGLSFKNTISNTLPITGFASKGNKVYAATLGNGVYIFDSLLNTWIPFNNSMPLNVAGSVNKIASANNYLFIASGGNGVFHKYNFTVDKWEEGYYLGSLSPGFQITDLINSSDTLTVVNGNNVFKTINAGISWAKDNTGTRLGVDRIIYSGSTNDYLVTNNLEKGSWIQKRNRLALIGESWAIDEEYVPNLYTYDMLEHKGKLFLATETGLYQKNLVLNNKELKKLNHTIQIYPNPSNGKVIDVISEFIIGSYTITNSFGQNIYSEEINKTKFNIEKDLTPGIYYINLYLINGNHIVKKITIY